MNLRNFVTTSDVKFLKSRCKRFARSFSSMNPRNFGDDYNFKFLKSSRSNCVEVGRDENLMKIL